MCVLVKTNYPGQSRGDTISLLNGVIEHPGNPGLQNASARISGPLNKETNAKANTLPDKVKQQLILVDSISPSLQFHKIRYKKQTYHGERVGLVDPCHQSCFSHEHVSKPTLHFSYL